MLKTTQSLHFISNFPGHLPSFQRATQNPSKSPPLNLRIKISCLRILSEGIFLDRAPSEPLSRSLFSTLDALFTITRYAIASTDRKTKLCFLRSFFKISPEEATLLQEEKESIAITFLMSSSSRLEIHPSIKETCAKLIVSAAIKTVNEGNSLPNKFITPMFVIRSTCDMLFTCNLPNNSPLLHLLLNDLDKISMGTATTYYFKINAENLEEENDENDVEKTLNGFSALELIETTYKNLQKLPKEKREEIAKDALFAILSLIEQAQGDEEIKHIIQGFCGRKGALRKCRLPNRSKALSHILSSLDRETGNIASKTYYNR